MSTKKEKCCEKCYFEVKYIEQIGTEPTTEGKMIDCRNEFCPCHQSESIEWQLKVRDWWYSIQDRQKCPDEIKRVEIERIIVDAITTAVAKRDAFLVEEVEKIYKDDISYHEKSGTVSLSDSSWHFQQAKSLKTYMDKILQILKH